MRVAKSTLESSAGEIVCETLAHGQTDHLASTKLAALARKEGVLEQRGPQKKPRPFFGRGFAFGMFPC
jgi:hypothetical protein